MPSLPRRVIAIQSARRIRRIAFRRCLALPLLRGCRLGDDAADGEPVPGRPGRRR